MSSYDEALFLQHLEQVAKFKTVTHQDVEDAFWVAASDLLAEIREHNPEEEQNARNMAREYLPDLIKAVTAKGYRVVADPNPTMH